MRPSPAALALPALCIALAACERPAGTAGAGDGFVAPCVAAQRPVTMTPPTLAAPLPAGVQGGVRVDYVVERDGRVSNVEVRASKPAGADATALPPEMERAVADAVATWRFPEPLVRCRGRMDMSLSVSTTTLPAR